MEGLWPIVLLASIGLFAWAISAQSRKALATRLAEGSQQFPAYLQSWEKALVKGDTSIIQRCGDDLIQAARYWQPNVVGSTANDIYRALLTRLQSHPELAPLVLHFGRVAYSVRRAGGILTIYDEQAIQNDIMVHTRES